MITDHQKNKRFLYTLIAFFMIISAGIITVSILLYRSEKAEEKKNKENELLSIAELKAGQIADYRRERYAEANFLFGNRSFITSVNNYIQSPGSPMYRAHVDDWLLTILKNHQYESIAIFDTTGRIVYELGKPNSLNEIHSTEALAALKEKKILFGNLYLHKDSVTIHLEIFAPLILDNGLSIEPVGVVNFTINPYTALFEIIQKWPVASPTAEAVLARRDGDDVLFLNNLRHLKNSALKIRRPLSLQNLPSVQGVLGREGIIEGIDYRGHEVLTAIKKIPDSDWIILAKIDKAEVFEELYSKTALLFGLMVSLIMGLGTAFFIVWRGQSIKQLKLEIQSVETIKRLNRVYEVLSHVNQAIVRIHQKDFLLQEICRIAVERGGYRLCWIGFTNESTALVIPAAKAGPASAYLDKITVSSDENIPAGQGPTGQTIRSGLPTVFNDLWSTFRLSPWKENALKYSLRASAALPLKINNKTTGTINFYSEQVNFFTPEETRLLEGLSENLSYAIENIEREKAKNETEESLGRTEALLKVVMDHLPIGVAVNSIDPTVKFNYMNDNFPGFYRTTKSALANEDEFWEAVYEDPVFREEIKQRVLDDCASGDPSRMRWEEVPIVRGNQTYYISAQNLPMPEKNLMISLVWDVTERKVSEQAIRESEEMFRRLFESSTDPILLLDDSGFTDCNQSALSILGYASKNEVINKKPWEISPEKQPDGKLSSEKAEEMISKALTQGHNRFEWVHRKSDGTDLFVEVMLTSMTLKERPFFYTVWRDITERRKAEAALKESNERFNLVARATNDAVWDWNVTENKTWWNDRFYLLFGFTSGVDVPGLETWVTKIHPDDRERVIEHFRNAIDGISQGWSDEFQYQFKDGSYGYIFDRAFIIRDDSGKAVRIIGSMIDITELKRAEKQLIESEARYRLISENSTDVIWLFDLLQLRITYVSPSVYKLRGFTPEEVLQHNVEQMLTPDSLKKFYDEITAFNTGDKTLKTKTIRVDQPHKDGHIVNTEIVVTVLPDETGNPTRVLGVSRDITERAKTEEQLLLQSSALNSVANGIVITDPDGVLEWVNPAFTALTGYSLEEAIGKNPRELVKSGAHDEDYYKELWATITSGQVWHGELINKRKDGSFYTEEQTITPIRDVYGKITHFIGVKQDITERTKNEMALRENEERLRLSMKATNQGFFDLNIQTGEAIVSEEYATMLGYDPKTFTETNAKWIERLHPDDKERTAKAYQDYINGLTSEYSVEFRQKTGSGAWKWILSIGKIVSWTPDGKPLRMLGTHTDLDTRKQAEEALRESEEKYKSFFEDDLTGDFVSTPDGKLTACNPAFARIFGYDSVEEALRMDVHSLYPDRRARENIVKRLKREKRLEYYSSELLRKDGKKIYVIENLIGKFDEDGELIEIKGYVFDDTQRQSLEKQLIQAQKMESLGTLAGGIAHDFNNILAIIMGHTSLIQRKSAGNDYVVQNAETITKATQRGAGLVKQLLTFARKTEVVLESILISDTIHEVRKFIEETFPKTIRIHTECENNLPPILADATQIHQILLNLCINARDAMPHGGTLSVTAARITKTASQEKSSAIKVSDYIHIKVTDTGIGMDAETQSHIFEPFFTTKGRERGTGLGLATVYGIVESHHGHINVESEIGKGTSFNLYFPVQQSFIQSEINADTVAEIAGGDETVLVVDDEEPMRYFLESIFAEKGYRVLIAGDGQEAVEIYGKHSQEIDLVLTDLGLPKMSGEELLETILKINPQVKVIIASGFFETKLKSSLIKMGVKEFVQKPYLPEDILKKAREVLDMK